MDIALAAVNLHLLAEYTTYRCTQAACVSTTQRGRTVTGARSATMLCSGTRESPQMTTLVKVRQ